MCKKTLEKKDLSLLQLKFDACLKMIVSRLDCNIQMRQRRMNGSVENQVWIEGRARTQSPTLTNYAPEFPTFGGIAGF